MIAGALFYYQVHWWQNRLLMRIRRLRQPKYLFGALVGGLYFYWYLFRNIRYGYRAVHLAPGHSMLMESIAALVLFSFFLLAWILPGKRTALAFSEAEVAFLFPAPISRQTLIHFKLLKSQSVILFSAIILTLAGRSWGTGFWAFHLLGWWVAFATLNLHLIGSSFVLTKLMDRGLSTWIRRVLVLGAAGALIAVIIVWFCHAMPSLPQMTEGADDLSQFRRYAVQVFNAGPLPYVLFPFRLVVAPYFAETARQFFVALGPALLILGLHYWWVTRSSVAFEEASVELSRKTAERVLAMRSGQWQMTQKPTKARRNPFSLSPVGNPAVAIFWKNLVSAGNLVTARVWILLIWITVFGGIMLQSVAKGEGGIKSGLTILALVLTMLSLFWGPQMLRNDFRQDLPVTDVLKMFPVAGWKIVLGEVLAPAAILAGAQWLLLVVAVFLCPDHFESHEFSWALRIGIAVAAALVLPCIDLIAMMIPNASVLVFPAWFQLGKEMPRGFETMGQQLILLFGQTLVLVMSITPAALVFTLAYFVMSRIFPPAVSVLPGSLGAAVVLLGEAALGIRVMGEAFARFDVSGEVLNQQ